MARMSRGRLTAIAVFAVLVGGAVWWINRSEPIPTKPPANAPKAGECWAIPSDQTPKAMPWPGGPVSCSSAHTAEMVQVGQVDRELTSKARVATGDDAKIAQGLMYAEARRACTESADRYLGTSWHRLQVTLLAAWIDPAGSGFYGCALAQITGPGGNTYVTRTGSLKGIGDGGPLTIGCVARTGDTVRFASCDQPHTGEFVGMYRITPDNAPFDAKAVSDAATKGCTQAALAYLGLPGTATRADLIVGYIGPSAAASWLGSDQTFDCYASASTPLRGTIRNLGTRPLPR